MPYESEQVRLDISRCDESLQSRLRNSLHTCPQSYHVKLKNGKNGNINFSDIAFPLYNI